MESTQRCFWNGDDLASYDIPSEAKDYLVTRGLPKTVGSSTIEFGVFESPDRCVIGQDYDFPIFVEPNGTVWHEPGDGHPAPQFMNSSVQLLDQFLEVYLSWHLGVEGAGDSVVREAISSAIQDLQQLDPPAFSDERWVWDQIWDDLMAQSC